MGGMRTYNTPAAFRAALSTRIRDRARAGAIPVDRVRTLVVMERFLARVVAVFPDTTILKGGLALELRLERARTTKDIDLRLLGSPGMTAVYMAKAAAHPVTPDDYLSFTAELDPEHPTVRGEGVVYEGFRYKVTPFIAAERYGDAFGVDVSFADALHGEPVTLIGGDAFAFIGVPPVTIRVYPPGSHIAEKLHAYTLPRRPDSENSRIKDLPDIALIAAIKGLDATDLLVAIQKTFVFRATHDVPASLPDAPTSWMEGYRRMAVQEGLPWAELGDLVLAVRAFLDPVLAGRAGTWDPELWGWV
jgi:hypothetical protein